MCIAYEILTVANIFAAGVKILDQQKYVVKQIVSLPPAPPVGGVGVKEAMSPAWRYHLERGQRPPRPLCGMCRVLERYHVDNVCSSTWLGVCIAFEISTAASTWLR